ncbi:hypothetical protein L873DRAFT_1846944, partial [Choiromyces venosus 120613-1]
MPLKRKPLGNLVPNGTLRPLKKPKNPEMTVPTQEPSSHPTEHSTSPLAPHQIAHNTISPILQSPPPSFECAEVEYKETRKRKPRRQRVSARDLPGLPKYDPLDIPFEPYKAQVLLPEGSSLHPFDLFSLFWDDSVFEWLAVNTNLYAKSKREGRKATGLKALRRWKETTPGELRIFIGLVIKMALHKEARL